MQSIWQHVNGLLDALSAAERACLFYSPKDARRDPHYHAAGHGYGAARRALEDWKRDYLTPAIREHAEAEAEERMT